VSVKRFGEAVTAGILARLEAGVSFKDAAIAEGVKPETARSWLTRGRGESDGPYADFALAVEESRAKAEAEAAKEMTPEEFEEHLSAAIRNGSVQAMKLWHEIRLAEKGGDGDSPPDLFDL
jgi:hypothetical protein